MSEGERPLSERMKSTVDMKENFAVLETAGWGAAPHCSCVALRIRISAIAVAETSHPLVLPPGCNSLGAADLVEPRSVGRQAC